MGEGDVVVGNIVEEMDLLLLEHESSGNGVNRSITPALIEETACMVQGRKVVDVGIGAEPVEIAYLEIGPEMAVVVRLSFVIADPFEGVALDDVLRVGCGEVLDGVPEGGNGLDVFVQAKGEAVLFVVLGHELEGVVFDVAEQLDAGLNAPVPLVVHHQGVAEEEAGFVSAHVPVADRIAVDDLLFLHLFADLGSPVLVDPFGEGPVLLWNLAVLCLAGYESGGDLYELVVEVVVIEEDPVVVELAVEAVLDMADGLGDLPDVRVAGEGHEGCVHARAISRGRRQLIAGVGSGRGRILSTLLCCWSIGVCGSWGLVTLVRGPLCGGDGRGRGDEEEEDDGLVVSAGCTLGCLVLETNNEGEDNVAQVALLTGHCGARVLLLRALLGLAFVRHGTLHFGDCVWVLRQAGEF